MVRNRALRCVARDERGFTLTELLTVVLILGILATIAIATFLGQREKAFRSAAISTLRNVHTTAISVAPDTGGFTGLPAAYELEQPSFDYVAAPAESTDFNQVSLWAAADGSAVAMAASGNTECFFLRLELTSVHRHSADAASTPCSADEFQTGVAGAGW